MLVFVLAPASVRRLALRIEHPRPLISAVDPQKEQAAQELRADFTKELCGTRLKDSGDSGSLHFFQLVMVGPSGDF